MATTQVKGEEEMRLGSLKLRETELGFEREDLDDCRSMEEREEDCISRWKRERGGSMEERERRTVGAGRSSERRR